MVEKTTVVQLQGDRIASVEVIAGQHVGVKQLLSAGTFVIGRDADTDLHLVNEPGVSRIHAKIVAERGYFRLVDNESRNGTLLNGAPARSELLYDGDLIDIAQCRILFRQMGGERRPPPTAPVVHTNPPAPAPSWSPPPAAAQAPVVLQAPVPDTSGRRVVIGTMLVTLVIVAGGGVAAWMLTDRGTTTTTAAVPAATVPPPVAPVAPPPPELPPAPAPTPPPAPSGPAFVEVKSENNTEIVRATERGRIQSTPAAVGTVVKLGDPLLILAGEVGNAADLATRRESIAALEAIAEGNEAAAKQLATEKAELRALMSKAPPKKIAAAVAGTVVALDVTVGEVVRQGQVIGRIETEAVVLRAAVTSAQTAGVQAGTTCDLRAASGGMAAGTVRDVVDRGAGAFEWVIDANTTQPITGVRCPSVP